MRINRGHDFWILYVATMLVIFAAYLLGARAFADVTVTASNYDTNAGEFDLTITGDAASVTLTLIRDGFDWCKPGGLGGTTATPTTPTMGAGNNDDENPKPSAVAIVGPVTTRCDIDPNAGWPGARVTVSGVTKDLVLGVAAVFSSSTPQPPNPPTVTGTAMLSWAAPTLNTDGSPLTNLAGFRVYWSAVQGTYTNSVTLADPLATTYVTQGLAAGTWYFVITSLNTAGVESAFSLAAAKTIAPTSPSDPCVVRPFTFSVNTWPGGLTGNRSLGYASNKPIDRLELTRTAARVTGIRATDYEGCTATVKR